MLRARLVCAGRPLFRAQGAHAPNLVLARSRCTVEPKPPPKTRWQTMKDSWREHGLVFLGTYAAAYCTSFGAAWGAISFFDVDPIALLRYFGADGLVDTSKLSPRVANAFIAMTIADLLEPIRLPLVLFATPMISALRRRRG
ncbi:hypothetical protein AB1Y20_010586 [Prymnesium parvum]|uniref:DUF1279 domain-containing protein n=1 Tax=Prymnesium parvum TaxID=97485 RepID=A0AB34IPQ2_PRYPA